MSDMVRKQIYLTRRHNALLKRLAKIRRVSEAEVIRQALDREVEALNLPEPLDRETAWNALVAFALSLRNREFTGEPYHWNRDEIYAERESRWIRERDETKE